MTAPVTIPAGSDQPYRIGVPLESDVHATVVRGMALEQCKWDGQVGDISTLLPFPLLMSAAEWQRLSDLSEKLAAETTEAEEELVRRPDLHKALGIPRSIRGILSTAANGGKTTVIPRIMRFDFHWTRQGWRISEVNSDVPGGFTESTSFTLMMAEVCGCGRPSGLPAFVWCDALAKAATPGGVVALLSAPGHIEDTQVVAYLAKQLEVRGCRALRMSPDNLSWIGGKAHAESQSVDLVVRFYQAEWLARHPRPSGWEFYFSGGSTPVANPGVTILTESKRFPLVWEQLGLPMDTWRGLLGETRDPRDAPWRHDADWMMKGTFGNTGDAVINPSTLTPTQWVVLVRDVLFRRSEWVAQRKFDAVGIESPAGVLYPCVGVYTVNGAAAGAYVRAARKPLVDYSALEMALLIEEQGGEVP